MMANVYWYYSKTCTNIQAGNSNDGPSEQKQSSLAKELAFGQSTSLTLNPGRDGAAQVGL